MQQINFFIPPEQKAAVLLSFGHMLMVAGLFVFILFGVSVAEFYSQYKKEVELLRLKSQQQNLNKGLANVQQAIPTEEDRERMEKEVAELNKVRAAREKMYSTLSQLHYGEAKGFAGFFRSLARHTVQGLWFTKLKFTRGGAFVTLEGRATDSSNVPKLLKELGNDPNFAGKHFELFRIYKDVPKTVDEETGATVNEPIGDIVFVLSSEG